MGNYQNVSVDWLVRMFEIGYVAILDADTQEVHDVVFEN